MVFPFGGGTTRGAVQSSASLCCSLIGKLFSKGFIFGLHMSSFGLLSLASPNPGGLFERRIVRDPHSPSPPFFPFSRGFSFCRGLLEILPFGELSLVQGSQVRFLRMGIQAE